MSSIFITGAAQGIGFTTSHHLAKAGYTVFALVRPTSNTYALEKLKETMEDKIRILVGDVTDVSSIDKAVASILNQSGRIDGVINNACHVVVGTSETCTLEEQIHSMDVNYFGPVRILQAVLPVMRKQRSGKVINISSVAGYEPFPHLESYVASKYALEGLSESMATHLAPWNISVSLIEPGGVKTEAPREASMGGRTVTDTDAYQRYCIHAKQQMADSYDESMDPQHVADVIEEILCHDKPHLRYPLGKFAKDRAAKRYFDPSGDSYVTFKRQLLQDSGLYALLGSVPKR